MLRAERISNLTKIAADLFKIADCETNKSGSIKEKVDELMYIAYIFNTMALIAASEIERQQAQKTHWKPTTPGEPVIEIMMTSIANNIEEALKGTPKTKCQQCGYELPEKSLFCERCGKKVHK